MTTPRALSVYFLVAMTSISLSFSSESFADKKVIKVAADPWCPFNCEPDQEHQGLIIDIAREALAMSGYKLNYESMNWARAKILVQNGDLDGIVGMAKTERSSPLYHFTRMPLGESKICLYKRKDDPWTYSSTDSLNNKVFGWINDYGFSSDPLDQWVSNHKNKDQVLTVSGKNTHERLFKLLQLKRIDTFAEDKNVIAYTLKQANLTSDIVVAGCLEESQDIYLAFSLKAPDRLLWSKAIESGLQTLSNNGRLESILRHYGLSTSNWVAAKHLESTASSEF